MNPLERCGICGDTLYRATVAGDPRCDSCIDERHKGRAWAEGAVEVLMPLLERLAKPIYVAATPVTYGPTPEDGLRLHEALEAAKRTYGGETP